MQFAFYCNHEDKLKTMMKIQRSVASVKGSLQYNIAIPLHVRKITRVIDRKKMYKSGEEVKRSLITFSFHLFNH